MRQPPLNKKEGLRDRTILETMYATGMRISEATNLNLEDINLDVGFIRCLGKGKRERIIPLGKLAIGNLKKYMDKSRPLYLGKNSSRALLAC